MFEDAMFESTGSIHTRSRRWMLATLLLNSSILVSLVLIPLFYPEALPHESLSILLTAPPPPPQPATAPATRQRVFHGIPQMDRGALIAPRLIPTDIARFRDVGSPVDSSLGLGDLPGATLAPSDVFPAQSKPTVAPAAKPGPVRVSSSVAAGRLVGKTLPVYPRIAVAARVEGTVILQATISAAGTIENLRVVSGPAMLQQAALDAVKQWRYQPFLLDGEPVEVETTVNVVFALNH